jgi:parallel beta-helix repeat protein
MSDEPYLGIDFGTTNSAMAWYNPRTGTAEEIFNAEGEAKTPSVVYIGQDEILVGKVADERVEDPENWPRIIRGVKLELTRERAWYLDGKCWAPLQIAAEVLKKLKKDAEEGVFHQPVKRAVITHPACFDEFEKERLQEAAQLAGFEEVELLAEPVAAALAFLKVKGQIGRSVLVYDFGGGTFDAALVVHDSFEKGFRLACPPQGERVGGELFDRLLYEHFEKSLGHPLSQDGYDLDFLRRCRSYKENVCTVAHPRPLSYQPRMRNEFFKFEIARPEFEAIIAEHVDRTLKVANKLIAEASTRGHKPDAVILIGGSSRVPLVKRRLQEVCGLEPLMWHKCDLAVAIGAAYRAYEKWKPARRSSTSNRNHRSEAQLQREIVVDPGGGGDVRTLAEAIERVTSGETIRLAEGTHWLDQPLKITKPVSLVGAGRDITRVVCEKEGSVIEYSSQGRFAAWGISFQHTGQLPADVLVVTGGDVAIRECRFEGGIYDKDRRLGGNGLWLRGTVWGVVERCESLRNGGCGILLSDAAQPTLEGNTCRENGKSGIAYFGSAAGTARKNTCQKNAFHGIRVSEQARPTLEGNTCRENGDCGIAYFGSAAGTARNNTCEHNSLHGIYVGEHAQPTLEENTCRQNGNCGIAYFDSAAGTARNNTCEKNEYNGIQVSEQAQPTLEGNTCRENGLSGIFYFGSAAGTARNNTCEHNSLHGIYVGEQAQPTLEGNTCRKNGKSGIAYFGSAAGTARNNTCEHNSLHGIYVDQQARPTLEANTCRENGDCGIAYFGSAAGTARNNTCEKNSLHGIYVDEHAQPTLEGNTCRENGNCGIAYFDSAAGTARKNTCEHNSLHGIYVGEQARPTLEGNTCRENGKSGIAYFGSAAGTARNNTCEKNEYNGIRVSEQAQPTLKGNTCRENGKSGIAYFGSAAGTARKNTCEHNSLHGIYVDQQAQPTLEGNTCRQNGQCGIAYFGSAAGTARKNTCEHNSLHGIYVGEHAQPTLEGNTCRQNGSCGIFYFGSAAGTARNNVCKENATYDIYVEQGAQPVLENNTANRKGAGVSPYDGAQPVLENNTANKTVQSGAAKNGSVIGGAIAAGSDQTIEKERQKDQ